ncbi:MAG: hypothetical protein ABI878_14870 [Acidobacteriota bacterium]
MKTLLPLVVLVCLLAGLGLAQSDFSPEVKRIAVFKNGYAFTYREAETKTTGGWAYTTNIPIAVLGTVWGYSTSPNVKVTELRTSETEKQETQRILSLAEFLLANEGSPIRAEITQSDGKTKVIQGTYEVISSVRGFKGMPNPLLNINSYESQVATTNGDMAIAVKTETGVIAFSAARIETVEVMGEAKWAKPKVVRQNRLGIRTEGVADGQTVNLGVAALERGIRWIPAYRVEVKGTPIKEAKIELEANLINELTDLQNTDTYFVVGVPHFLFQDTMSPLSMNTAFAGVSSYFQDARNNRDVNISSRQLMNVADGAGYDQTQSAPSPTLVNDEQLNSFSAEQLFLY